MTRVIDTRRAARYAVRGKEGVMRAIGMSLLMFLVTVAPAAPVQWRGSQEDVGRRTAICQLPHGSGIPIQLSGTVLRVDPIESLRTDDTCIHFLMQTAEDVLEIHVGTYGALRKDHIEFTQGDVVTVVGSRLGHRIGNRVIVLAKTITRDGKTFVLKAR